MKILITNRLYHPVLGGSVVLTDCLANSLRSLGHEVKITTRTKPNESTRDSPCIERSSSFWQVHRSACQSDAVIMIEPSVFYASAAFLSKRPRIGSLQTWFLAHSSDFRPARRLQKAITHFFSKYVAPSRIIDESWCFGHEIVPNGYDPGIFHNQSIPRNFDFAFIGRFNRDKGADLFANALELLHSKGKAFQALFIGDGETLGLCREIIDRNPGLSEKVSFTGELNDRHEIAGLLNRSKVMVIPNRWDEPFGMVVLEGLACGCRLVATQSGALADVSGGFANLVPKENVPVMADAMMHEVALPPHDPAIITDYLRNYHWDKIAEQYLSLLGSPT